MAKLDKSKLASGRIQTNMGALPNFSKPQSTPAAEEKKESVKVTETPAEEKKKPEEAIKPAETNPEAKPVPSVGAQATPEKKKEEKSAPAEKKMPAAVQPAPADKRRGRGRPPIHAKTLDEQGQPLTNINIMLSDELHRYLDFAASMSGKKSKAACVRELIQKNYEKNYEKFRQWEKGSGDDFLS